MKETMCYAEKYDPCCKAMHTVFDYIYTNVVKSYGIRANMVMVSGEDVDRYIKYIAPLISGVPCKAVIMENNRERVKRLRTKLLQSLKKRNIHNKKVKVVSGNIITYQDNHKVNNFIKTPARFIDLGLGIGFEALTEMARLVLFNQQKVYRYKKRKMLVLDGARRRIHDADCVKALNNVLAKIDQKIVTINGVDVSETSSFYNKRYSGKGIFTIGKKLPCTEIKKSSMGPMKHSVVLIGNKKREAKLTLFTYTNGNGMLTATLQYK